MRQDLYDKYNELGISAVRKYLDREGYYTRVQENFKADIRSAKKENHEVEVKKAWKGGDWPYQRVYVPYRKKALVESGATFWMVRRDGKRAFVAPALVVGGGQVVELDFKGKKEHFYSTPLEGWIYKEL